MQLSVKDGEDEELLPHINKLSKQIANLISKLNFYKLIPYPMDNMLNRSAHTGPPNARKRRPVFPPAGRSVVLCTPQMAPHTSFLSRQPDVIASFSLSKPLRPHCGPVHLSGAQPVPPNVRQKRPELGSDRDR